MKKSGRENQKRNSELPEFSLAPRVPGTELAEWLNEHQNTAPAVQISSLILKIRKLQHLEAAHKRTLWMQPADDAGVDFPGLGKMVGVKAVTSRTKRRGTFWQRFEYHHFTERDIRRWRKSDPIGAEIGRLNLEIKRDLDKFSFVPRLHVSALDTRVGWLPASQGQQDSTHDMVGVLLWLVERGLLDSIAQCAKCGRWFCSRRSRRLGDKRFCGTKCQQEHYKSSPDWKAYRARYMRRYRKTTGAGGK
jgi:hypothetical protein